jgi:hypothetical protein
LLAEWDLSGLTESEDADDPRKTIYNYILANPFITHDDLLRALGLPVIEMDFHLRDLVGMGEVSSRKEFGTTYYFPIMINDKNESEDDIDPYRADLGTKNGPKSSPVPTKSMVDWESETKEEEEKPKAGPIVEWLDWEEELKIDELYIVTKSGELLGHFRFNGVARVDENILASMLTVIQNFVNDSFSTGGLPLKELVFDDSNLQVIPGRYLNVVAITTEGDPGDLVEPLTGLLEEIEEMNENVLRDFDGDASKLKGIQECVKKVTGNV